ncbi:MAG: cupin domain-containing protein [Candidatus Bathyarchaeia archaeon]
MIVKKVKEVKDYDVKEAYGQDAEGVSIRWISEKRTGGDEYLHNFALRYFTFKPNAYMNPHKHPWEQEIAVTKGKIQVLGAVNDQILRESDVGYFPANEVHGFKNLSDGDSEFYCVIGCVGKGENCLGIQG